MATILKLAKISQICKIWSHWRREFGVGNGDWKGPKKICSIFFGPKFRIIRSLNLLVPSLVNLVWPEVDVIKLFWRKSEKSRFPLKPKQQEMAILTEINSSKI